MAKYYSERIPNGIELPDINTVWTDKVKYPYAQISLYANSTTENMVYILRLLTTEGTVSSGGLVGITSVYRYDSNKPEKGWYQYNFSFGSAIVVWANYDVYYKDDVADVGGTLYLKGSDPVPVGGEPEPVLSWNGKDAYCVINGSWVRCDVVKPTDGIWVKQDSYS